MSSTRTRTKRSRSQSLDTLTVALVARQSRSDDGSQSVPDQIDTMRADCERRGWLVGGVYQETDVSGQRPLVRRTGLKRAVADVEEGRAQVVMVAYFDRLCRSLKTQIEVVDRVEDAGGAVQVANGSAISHATPTDRLTSTMLGAVAEYVALTAGERTAVTKQRNINNGVPPFPRITPAYQRREDGTLELHPTNGPLVREAVAMRLRGASYTTIARWLNEQGLTKADDDGVEQPLTIGVSGVESMLSSPLMHGAIHFGEFEPNHHAIADPICDVETFKRMHKAKSSRGRYAKSERLLSRLGVLVCGTCGSRMSIHHTGSKGKTYAYYRCGNRLCEHGAVISCDVAETFVRDEAIRLSSEVKGRASAKRELNDARKTAEQAKAKLASAIRTLAGLDDEAATRETLDALRVERDEAVAAHQRLASLIAPDMTITTLADWEKLSLDGKRGVIHAVIARAVVAPGRGDARITIDSRELLAQ